VVWNQHETLGPFCWLYSGSRILFIGTSTSEIDSFTIAKAGRGQDRSRGITTIYLACITHLLLGGDLKVPYEEWPKLDPRQDLLVPVSLNIPNLCQKGAVHVSNL
jgi:hypothetical protein